ncbi:MAG: hypothetical protein K2L51_02750, partial [Clostridiales bacterium]|nr:hypothetical protein [Clostridiales bacterium]
VLARIEDYESHPAYSRMFVQTGYGEAGRSVWARREGEGVTALLCVQSEGEARYTSDKCLLAGRGRATNASQNGNPVLAATVTRALNVGQVCTLTCCFLAAETTEQAEHAVRLAYSDCLARSAGAYGPLARAVSPYARKTARMLLSGALGACACDAVGQDKPTVAHEITDKSLTRLQNVLSDLRLLYEAGFSFHTVLYCRKRVGAYPAHCFDAERAVDLSGIRGVLGGNGTVTVLQCDERTYAALRAHAPEKQTPEPVRFAGGKAIPAIQGARNSSRVAYTETMRRQDHAALSALLPVVSRPLGIGGFAEDGAYVVCGAQTPAPWCNIMSNGEIGTVVGESGGGFTFADNARQYKFTEWT